ncbi:4-aminobutyrate--2-oxoglutarate transaminase [Salinicoccus albus]|uniref:4-aminobutyrate--2-oxoglutarate transaminase n=1 Tax=Salinicoccus albus TaxID=418756 RepID=UPI000375FCB8|nr:4-aminobutyrate--2-oxoglutarate transaminase [Salinicoccus albus]
MTQINELKNDNTEELQDKRDKFIPRGVSNGNRNIAAKAESATITDIDGTPFIDFAGAIGTLNVGHSHPKVTAAVKDQIDKFLHPGFNVMMYKGYIELAEKLSQMTPGRFDKKAMLLNSGSEAVENAVKAARKYTGKQAVVSFKRAFHGRTNLTMGMTSKVKPYKFGFGPFAPEIYQAPYPYTNYRPEGVSEADYIEQTIEDFKNFFIETVAPETVACVVMEPVQGEGGFIIPDKKFVTAVADFCKENNIVFLADEIQTGFGRTGKLFGMEHFGVEPDLVTVSKSLAAGLPLSGVVGKSEILDASEPGELGGTYAGNPVACAAALSVIDIINDEQVLEKAEIQGQKIEDKLHQLKEHHDFTGEIRRLGAMVAVEIMNGEDEPQPDKGKTSAITKYANDNGLLLLSAGIKGNVIRFLIPLVATDNEIEKGLEILEGAFETAQEANHD